MADRHSSLAEIAASPAANAPVVLREIRPGSILQIAAWPDMVNIVRGVMQVFLGVEAPESGKAATGKDATVAAVGPGRYLIAGTSPDLVTRFEGALLTANAAVTDLSHGLVILRAEGEAVVELLSRCLALDFDLSVFPPGRVARSDIHHVDVVVHRLSENSFELWGYRSFAEALVEWILDAGAELPVAWQRSVS